MRDSFGSTFPIHTYGCSRQFVEFGKGCFIHTRNQVTDLLKYIVTFDGSLFVSRSSGVVGTKKFSDLSV